LLVIDGSMPIWQYGTNRGLTFLENLPPGQNLGDFHGVLHTYRRQVLEVVPSANAAPAC
jgi:hypothetical protein